MGTFRVVPRNVDALRLQSEIETFEQVGDVLSRRVRLRNNKIAITELPHPIDGRPADDLSAIFDKSWLLGLESREKKSSKKTIRVVDLFAGCGGLALGVKEAANALDLRSEVRMAVDTDPKALSVFSANFPEAMCLDEDVEHLLPGRPRSKLSSSERSLNTELGAIDLLVGGPPCQGHSDLNNHTRNQDFRNELYLKMARFCEVIRPQHVIIENVPGVLRDKHQVAQRTWQELRRQGYFVQSATIDVSEFGVAQRRKRNLTIASLSVTDNFEEFLALMQRSGRTLKWAIGDLQSTRSTSIWDTSPKPSAENSKRIKYLFDNNLFNLPDSERPDCHRLKDHSYVSIYGRLKWDQPAPTITTGFGSMGRGRNVHPSQRRTITPHEAARIQFFPDSFSFGSHGRTQIQKLIGNAVPPKLGYLIGLYLLR